MAKSGALLGLSVLVLLLAACGQATPSTTPIPTPVLTASPSPSLPTESPSASVAPSPTEPRASTSTGTGVAQPCTAADLDVEGSEWGGAAGSRGTDVTVTEKGTRACILPASPQVVMIDPAGAVVLRTSGRAGSGPTLRAGATTTFSIQFSNWCSETARLPFHFTVLLATGSIEIAELAITSPDQLPPCNGPGQPAVISATPWEGL